jgi:hypothetical protein
MFHNYAHRMQDKIKTRRQVIILLKGCSISDIRGKLQEIKIPFMRKLRAA